MYQALLSAINLGNEEIAEIIVEHSKYEEISADLKQHGKAFFYQNKFHDDNQFSEEITPLILASQQNRFEVVMALLLKGETIERPHKCHCTCADCDEQARRDELKFARSRLNAYRALSSEAYISLSSDDPILTSFRLRREIQQVANEEKYYTVRTYLIKYVFFQSSTYIGSRLAQLFNTQKYQPMARRFSHNSRVDFKNCATILRTRLMSI